jgi:ATP-binding cassette subfamily B (MDR/TAP) protein 1
MVTATVSIGHWLPTLKDLGEAKKAAKKIFDLIDRESVLDERAGRVIGDLKGDIEFEEVEFSYPQRPGAQILNRFNLTIPAGKTVALVGSR